MDLWFVGKIALCIAAALLFGLALGWMIWARGRKQWQARFEEAESRRQAASADLEVANREISTVLNRLNETEAARTREVGSLQSSLESLTNDLRGMEGRLGERASTIATLRSELDASAEASTRLEAKLAGADSALADRDARLRELNAKVIELEAALSARSAATDEMASNLETANARVASLEEHVHRRDGEVADLEQMLSVRDRRIGELELEISAQTTRVAELETRVAQLESLEVRASELETIVDVRDGRIAEFELETSTRATEVAQLEARLAQLEPLEVRASELKTIVDLREGRIAELQRRLADEEAGARAARAEVTTLISEVERLRGLLKMREARVAELQNGRLTPLGIPEADHDDDLQRIHGIGPKLEAVLRRLGIRSWEQIAGFTDADIDRVAEAIETFPDRIVRDDWMGSARGLLVDHDPTTPMAITELGIPVATEKDDLKKVHGIGPKLERVLNRLGITSFRQIANFSDEDVTRVAKAIETFPDRIVRDDWRGGAAREFRAKYGEGSSIGR